MALATVSESGTDENGVSIEGQLVANVAPNFKRSQGGSLALHVQSTRQNWPIYRYCELKKNIENSCEMKLISILTLGEFNILPSVLPA
jgi:hypothetical protein